MIKYIEGNFRYQLAEDHKFRTAIKPERNISTFFIHLDTDGNGLVRKGYAWDGPSGPTIDTPDFIRPSLEHDVKYELMRKELIGQEWRAAADSELKESCIENKMPKFRAHYVYEFVVDFGMPSANPKNRKQILTAP